MLETLFTTIALGFALGIKHALDADHVVALSTIVSQYRSPMRAAMAGVFWGIGHTATLLIVGIGVIGFKLVIPNQLVLVMEFVVGVMLVILGIQTLWQLRPNKEHTHTHIHEDERELHIHEHVHGSTKNQSNIHHSRFQHRSLFVGMIHGLAGSGALMLLVLSTIQSSLEGIIYILIFGMGSILGMMITSALIGLPFSLSAERFTHMNEAIKFAAGVLSIVLGFVVMFEIGVNQGLF